MCIVYLLENKITTTYTNINTTTTATTYAIQIWCEEEIICSTILWQYNKRKKKA